MNKKILIIIGILALCIILAVGLMKFWEKPEFGTCKTDADCKNVRCVGAYCDNGICKCPPGKTGDLSQVKVASLYEYVSDFEVWGRTKYDVVKLLNETKTDFIFRGFWKWSACPESPDATEIPPGYPQEYPEYVERRAKEGYTYQQLKEAINEIKKHNPDVIFCGAIPAQRITKFAYNPTSGEYFGPEETWEMALDPEKWGIDVSKKEFQCWNAKREHWVDQDFDCEDYDPKQVYSYFPDITNEKFQELFLSWAKKQIDCGADAIWIDAQYYQMEKLLERTKDLTHSAVKESFESASKMVDEIHNYGLSKGKYIYVGSWHSTVVRPYPYPQPNLDFITVSLSSKEIYLMKLDERKWDDVATKVNEKLGNIPIFAFMDWASGDWTPLAVFSQNLTPDEQREFLRTADEFFQKKGIIFVYPIHGGYMGKNAEILSFGKLGDYDSLAPEFQTYATIKELARNKT